MIHRNWVVAYTYNPSTWEVEAGRSEVPAHPQLRTEVEPSLGYMSSFLRVVRGD